MEDISLSPQEKISYPFMNPSLTTKLEKKTRYSLCDQTAPELSKTVPIYNRDSSPESIKKAVVISHKSRDKAPTLSKLYNPTKKETYLEQVFVIEKELGVGKNYFLAVEHLHKHNVLHLDIKPENIFLSANGVCKLGDFGLIFDLNKDDPNTAEEGDTRYLAAEFFNNCLPRDQIVTKALDIFSLGISILELATDVYLPRRGHINKSDQFVYDPHWHILRSGHTPEIFIERISPELRNIIEWMMDPNPTFRPSANELLKHPILLDIISLSPNPRSFVNLVRWIEKAISLTTPRDYIRYFTMV
uniref:non-specific serine/threonine protein kinase n=1 Tax=Acrobeloides nanus TaxID=290746 RepID=A0A914E0C8_9BILA